MNVSAWRAPRLQSALFAGNHDATMNNFATRTTGRLGAAFVLGLALALVGCERPEQAAAPAERPPPPVDVATPLVKDVVEWDEYTGRFEAVQRVEVQARVSGYLDAIKFTDGDLVDKGDLLFVIDPRPFEAELARVKAEVTRAQAALARADAELGRFERLLKRQAASRDDYDERVARRKEAQAQVTAARAAVRSAELDVEFTQVRAPISGRISDARVDVGNLVTGETLQADLLTTIVSLDPIYFVFDASEADYLRYTRLGRSGRRQSSREAANPVFVKLMDENEWTHRGEMNFVDNELDPNSGTMRGRAVFANPQRFFAPGVFGRLRLVGSGEYQAMLLPDSAILSDQSRKIVMSVNTDGTVVPRPVELGPIVEGLRVVRSGITAQTRVVVSGIQRARPGAKVTAQDVKVETTEVSVR